jgi:hypothetical protein
MVIARRVSGGYRTRLTGKAFSFFFDFFTGLDKKRRNEYLLHDKLRYELLLRRR